MTPQATNSLHLYRGGDPAVIEQLLKRQNASVVNELKSHFGVNTIPELAISLSRS